MTVDFQYVAHRLPEFGTALKAKLAAMARVPENALRLNGLREGSIIAEFFVMPTIKPFYVNPLHVIERLHEAIDHDDDAKNAAELCALTGGPLEGCKVQFKDLGFVSPSVKPFKPEPRTEQQQIAQEGGDINYMFIAVCAIAAAMLLLVAMCTKYLARRYRKANEAKTYETKVWKMEEGNTVEGKPVKEEDSTSTNCPSNSEEQSEQSISEVISDDVEFAWPPTEPEQGTKPSLCAARPRSAERDRT
jgi:hypothetical protein